MATTSKVNQVQKASKWIEESTGLIFTEYRGLSVDAIQRLRTQLREVGGEYHVIKNTLLRRALGDQASALPSELHNGPTATLFIFREEAACAKKLFEFAKTNQALRVKGAVIEGKVMDAQQIEALSKLPSRQELLGLVAGCVAAPLSNLVGVLQETLAAPIRAIGQIAEKQEAAA